MICLLKLNLTYIVFELILIEKISTIHWYYFHKNKIKIAKNELNLSFSFYLASNYIYFLFLSNKIRDWMMKEENESRKFNWTDFVEI